MKRVRARRIQLSPLIATAAVQICDFSMIRDLDMLIA